MVVLRCKICGDDDFGIIIVDLCVQGVRGEIGKNDRMNGFDSGVGQYCEGGFGDYWQIDYYVVVFFNVKFFQDIGYFVY